ncbi:MAG: hypothetical protein SH817_10445 [Leptospira sp.]|nr:hypothetical protein [Leptospira sp.]
MKFISNLKQAFRVGVKEFHTLQSYELQKRSLLLDVIIQYDDHGSSEQRISLMDLENWLVNLKNGTPRWVKYLSITILPLRDIK